MSTAVASHSSTPLPPLDRGIDRSPKSYPTLAPSTSAPSIEHSVEPQNGMTSNYNASPGDSTAQRTPPDGKRSPKLSRSTGGGPKIIVKKEPPSSPSLKANSRHRPRNLDLSGNTGSVAAGLNSNSRPSAGPMTGREGIVMQDVGLACLSPGFQTHDPAMREQLQRSISVRDQQRSIIEARLLQTAKGDGPEGQKPSEMANPFSKSQGSSSSKKRPPPGLSIVPPSAEQFANERVIQSAPLHQTFTGRHQPLPMTRHVANQPSNLSNTSHIHHGPAVQTNNRLPPISDVFGSDTLGPNSNRHQYYPPNSASNSSHSNQRPPFPSPGAPQHTPHVAAQTSRPREYRSAEEAVHELAGGREDLLPRIVHYGGHQPPTPPSPQVGHGLTPNKYGQQHPVNHDPRVGPTSRRRSRNEYEGDSSPPLGTGREKPQYGPFGAGRDSPDSQRRKKDEFLGLCARAWDLFHS